MKQHVSTKSDVSPRKVGMDEITVASVRFKFDHTFFPCRAQEYRFFFFNKLGHGYSISYPPWPGLANFIIR